MESFRSELIEASSLIPSKYLGPGGALAIVRNGEVLVKTTWGFADAATGKELTVDTLMPICSITKQFTCALLLDLFPDPEVLADGIAQYLPKLTGPIPTIRELCNNQSGVRDYPTMSILCGLGAEDVFRNEDIQQILSQIRSTQSIPGEEYAYSNTNFHILARLLEERTGREFGDLLRERLFDRAGMASARFIHDSEESDKTCIGYEGSFSQGFFQARNRSRWIGDAGINASLEDMIAWEQYIHRTDHDGNSLYRKLSQPQYFTDGSAAPYGFGLSHYRVAGADAVGHTGGMRGWRLHRSYVRSAGLSVVAMFNHESDARQAVCDLLEIGLSGVCDNLIAPKASTALAGEYVDRRRGQWVEVKEMSAAPYAIELEGEQHAAEVGRDNSLVCDACTLNERDSTVTLSYPDHRLPSTLDRLGLARPAPEGSFRCLELDATLTFRAGSHATYGCFQGVFGKSPFSIVRPAGDDVWLLANQRGIDVAPGAMTIIVERDDSGAISGLRVSAPMARNLRFEPSV